MTMYGFDPRIAQSWAFFSYLSAIETFLGLVLHLYFLNYLEIVMGLQKEHQKFYRCE